MCLNIFYNKNFPENLKMHVSITKPAPRNTSDKMKKNRLKHPRQQMAYLTLWIAVIAHLRNPWSLWTLTQERLLLCIFLFSINQIPPFRNILQRNLGDWPYALVPYMPTKHIASSLRQSFGPPFVLYTMASFTRQCQELGPMPTSWCILKLIISATSAIAASLAGCFFRPDNDWACNSWLVGPIHSRARKRLHSFLMATSVILNVICLLFYSCCDGQIK